MKDIRIRKATKSDLPVIGKLLAELVNAMDDTECIDIRIALRTWEHLLKDARSHFLIAATKGTPVGFIHFTVRQTVLHRSPSAMIDELLVTKEYQGKGIGKQLVLATIEKCKQIGCCEVEVSTEKTNVKARKFYKKCGFNKREILFEVDL
ncbi:MAG: GNAT family N-acetyltransferase [Dehalococcoidia bacterium]|nr:GNAT family N-acetyltransferase [Dehalococcoidia bacterium]